MNSVLYDDNGRSQWAGPLDHVYRAVKHHVADGMYIIANRDDERMELLVREDGIVFPVASRESVTDDAASIRRFADEGRSRRDEMLEVAKARLQDHIAELQDGRNSSASVDDDE